MVILLIEINSLLILDLEELYSRKINPKNCSHYNNQLKVINIIKILLIHGIFIILYTAVR